MRGRSRPTATPAILGALAASGPLTTYEVADAAGLSYPAARRRLIKLAARGRVLRLDGGWRVLWGFGPEARGRLAPAPCPPAPRCRGLGAFALAPRGAPAPAPALATAAARGGLDYATAEAAARLAAGAWGPGRLTSRDFAGRPRRLPAAAVAGEGAP